MVLSINKTISASIGFSSRELEKIAAAVLKKYGDPDTALGLYFVGEKRMRTLNRLSRGKDKSTDVLSFPLTTDRSFSPVKELGDIFICPEYIRRQARRFHVSYREEMVRMFVHGILHLLGYDHIKKTDAAIMFPIQEAYVKKFV